MTDTTDLRVAACNFRGSARSVRPHPANPHVVRASDIAHFVDTDCAVIAQRVNEAADALDAKDRTIAGLEAEVERLRAYAENIASRKPREERLGNELPFRCRVCGYRGFVTGEERHADDCAYVLACAALKGQTP